VSPAAKNASPAILNSKAEIVVELVNVLVVWDSKKDVQAVAKQC
jgi:hypothetical protein